MLILGQIALGQDLEKETLYFDFNSENVSCPYNLRFVIERDTTVQFNLCGKLIFLYDKENKVDTISKAAFNNLKIVRANDIDSIRTAWFSRNDSILDIKYNNHRVPMPNQHIFNPYVVVGYVDDCYVVYPVRWKSVWRN